MPVDGMILSISFPPTTFYEKNGKTGLGGVGAGTVGLETDMAGQKENDPSLPFLPD